MKEEDNHQRKHKCLINGCDDRGRLIGKLGDRELSYCPKHRDYGVRVLDFFIDSLLRHKLTKFLEEARIDIFMENKPILSDESKQKLADYIESMTDKIVEIEKIDKIKKGEKIKKSEEFKDG